ncbi:hypothetical protein OSJ77_10275 [Phyllobacterium sp. 0TCS1.6C]|uniref:hypothetical protein n=1 Tax=unclassified Phyllobacterium TaxID=2638441 RepID=UPI002265567C|nr:MULTISPECIES: hypothetical protein [unclassified Phyllobacterium]MCX8280577.1 hypothetical protein [Phyllobacterium sp. 0TCS1.6C]MCX8294974.1 hypothetical protein [Phyllobacterium sp. 0TCS1.6A]
MAADKAAASTERKPFIYFATTDPFLAPGQKPTRNDVTLFGGPFTTDTAGGALSIFGADYTSNYIIGVTYGRDVFDLGAGFLLGGVAGVAIRFGEDDDTSGEIWGGVRLKHQGLVIGDIVISPAFTAGLSAVTGETEIEKEREARYDGDASFIGFLGPELSVRWRGAPNLELTWQLHHRSGGGGTFGDMGETSNANTIGIRYRF